MIARGWFTMAALVLSVLGTQEAHAQGLPDWMTVRSDHLLRSRTLASAWSGSEHAQRSRAPRAGAYMIGVGAGVLATAIVYWPLLGWPCANHDEKVRNVAAGSAAAAVGVALTAVGINLMRRALRGDRLRRPDKLFVPITAIGAAAATAGLLFGFAPPVYCALDRS